jgi:hypothetical protein
MASAIAPIPIGRRIVDRIIFLPFWIAAAAPFVIVMAGIVPAIHTFDLAPDSRRGCPAQGRA